MTNHNTTYRSGQEPISVEPIVVMHDVDRFLLNTEAAFRVATEAVDAANVPLSGREVVGAYAEQKRRRALGEIATGFNVVGYIDETLYQRNSEATWANTIHDKFVDIGRDHDLLMPGASDYIQAVRDTGLYQGLLTYGSWSNEIGDEGNTRERSVQWQHSKVAASPLLASLPVHVLSHPRKAQYWSEERAVNVRDYFDRVQLQRWRHAVGGLNLPGDHTRGVRLPHDLVSRDEPPRRIFARHVIQGDDKAETFDRLDPKLVTGIHGLLAQKDNQMSYQKTSTEHEAQAGVVNVLGLYEARDALLRRIAEIRGGGAR